MKKIKLIIACIAAILLVTGVLVLSLINSKASNRANTEDVLFGLTPELNSFTEKTAEAEGNNDDDNKAVAKIEDTIITKESFDSYKALWKAADKVPSDSELLDKIIRNEAVYINALKEGITVSDEDLEKALQEQKNSYSSDEEIKNTIDALSESLNITVDQYWERLKPAVKKVMIRGKYKDKIKKNFMSENIDYAPGNDFRDKFNKYYEDKISDLMKNMKIEKYID